MAVLVLLFFSCPKADDNLSKTDTNSAPSSVCSIEDDQIAGCCVDIEPSGDELDVVESADETKTVTVCPAAVDSLQSASVPELSRKEKRRLKKKQRQQVKKEQTSAKSSALPAPGVAESQDSALRTGTEETTVSKSALPVSVDSAEVSNDSLTVETGVDPYGPPAVSPEATSMPLSRHFSSVSLQSALEQPSGNLLALSGVGSPCTHLLVRDSSTTTRSTFSSVSDHSDVGVVASSASVSRRSPSPQRHVKNSTSSSSSSTSTSASGCTSAHAHSQDTYQVGCMLIIVW